MTGRSSAEFGLFVDRSRRALAQQVSGHTEAFQALWSHTDDVVLMGALGGDALGWSEVSASLSWASSHLDYDNWHADNLLTAVNDNLGFTLDMEHMSREINGQVQERSLRASQGYRFENGEWRIIFRHGDPMAERVVPPEIGQNGLRSSSTRVD